MRPDKSGGPDDEMNDILALLATLDHPLPQVSTAAIAARARARTRLQRRRAIGWAAAAVLTLGAAGVAVAMPGSPIRRWVTAILAASGRRQAPAPTPAAPAPPPPASHAGSSAGIAVAPGNGLTIVLAVHRPGGVATISFVDEAEVVARAPSGLARFTTEPQRLLIDLASSDTVTIEIPRTAPRVEIRTPAARLLLAEHGSLVPVASSDELGRYHLRLPVTVPAH